MSLRLIAAAFFAAGCALLSVARASVPLTYYLPPGTVYDPKVPTPEAYLGFQVGDWHLTSHQLGGYLRAVAAAAPDRVKLEVVGRTHEQKPLYVLTVTSPANHASLEKIRADHLAMLDPARAARVDVASLPVVVNMGYSVHGNEPSGVNAVPLVLYHLAAAQGPAIEAQLKQAVVLIEAQRNPDGGDRAAHWFNSNRSVNLSADPESREHNEGWPRGRFNHYLFDPNRDWLPLVHPEAQARAELFHRWRPHVLTDHHEMGTNTTFFFQPGVPTRNNPNIPARVIELTGKVAAFHQKAFDGRGVFYYNEQGFDDFYPGKGSTYPDLHGTIGILFEQASSRGHLQESDNGLLAFPFTIRNQVLTSFSTLEAAIALRSELQTLQREFTPQTLELARKSRTKAYVFGDDDDPARAAAFLDLLARHRIEVRALRADVTAGGRVFRPGRAWLVVTEQPQYRLLTEVFGRRTTFEDSIFYDVSGWTVPLGFNLPYAELEQVPAAGEPLGTPAFPAGALVGGHTDYAYLFNWNGYYAPRALLRLQKAGVLVKGLTGGPIEAVIGDGSRARFSAGAILVPVGMQPEKAALIRGLVDTIVREDAVTVFGCKTGLTPVGVDLGSASFVVLKQPHVALITGQGVDALDIGAAWHVLDQRVGLAVTLLEQAQTARADLARYNVIVLADGTYDGISDLAVTSLKRWVREGGTLIVSGRATEWAARKELAAIEFVGAAAPAATAAAATGTAATGGSRSRSAGAGESDEKPVARRPYGTGVDTEALKLVAGAVFAASVDVTHPLGYGFSSDRLSVLRNNTLMLKPAKSPYETPVVYTEQPLQSGYISADNLRRLAGSAAVVALPTGRGCVVAMPDDPNFRGFWYGGNRVFFNAIFYGRAIRAIRAAGDIGHEHADDHYHTH